MRFTFALCLIFLLPGCAVLPPVASFASWTFGGVTYAVSGKTVSDHAISTITQEDCAVLRVLDKKPVCREFAEGEKPILVAYDGEEIYPTGIEGRRPFDGKPQVAQPEATRLAGVAPELTTAVGPPAPPADSPPKAAARPVSISGAASGTELDQAGIVAARVKSMTGSIWASELIGGVWPAATRTSRATARFAAAPAVAAKSTPAPNRRGKLLLAAEQIVAPPTTPRPRPRSLPARRAAIPVLAMRKPGMMDLVAPALPTPIRTADAGAEGTPTATTEWHFVVIGSFAYIDNAAARAAQFRGMGPEILPAEINGQRYSRVVVGPFRTEDLTSAKLQIRAVGIADAWSMPAIGGSWNATNTLRKSDG